MKSNEQIIAELRKQVGELSERSDEAVDGINALVDFINREGNELEIKYVLAELGEMKLRLTGEYYEN